MAPIDRCLVSIAKLFLTQPARATVPTIYRFLAPAALQQQQRYASVIRIKKAPSKKKALSKDFRRVKLEKTEFPQWALVDALRYETRTKLEVVSDRIY